MLSWRLLSACNRECSHSCVVGFADGAFLCGLGCVVEKRSKCTWSAYLHRPKGENGQVVQRRFGEFFIGARDHLCRHGTAGFEAPNSYIDLFGRFRPMPLRLQRG